MTEKIIMAAFVGVLGIFAILLFKDAKKRERQNEKTREKTNEKTKEHEDAKALKEVLAKWKNKIFPGKAGTNTVYSGAPVIHVRVPGQKYYVSKEMDKKVFTIGRDPENDIVLDDPKVSGFHAKIVRHKDRWGAFYYFKNGTPTNGTHYYNQEDLEYQIMKDKEAIDLEEKEAFYIGDYKLIIETPQKEIRANEDELEIKKESKRKMSDDKQTKSEEKEASKTSGTKAYEKEDMHHVREQMHKEKYSTKRLPSQRNTSEDELNNRF